VRQNFATQICSFYGIIIFLQSFRALLRFFADRTIREQRPERLSDFESDSVISDAISGRVRRETQGDASCMLFDTECSLLLVSRGEVLSAWWRPIARVTAVQGVLREETAIVLVHSARPESGTLRELDSGAILRLDLGLHGRRWPLQVSTHVACCRSPGCRRLSLIHRRWCLDRD